MTLKEFRKQMYAEVVRFVVENPNITFGEVGKKFGMSGVSVGTAVHAAGLAPRKRGRKTGISPAKRIK